MKRILSIFALLLLAVAGASAQSSVWKVQKGESVLYLGGTIHVLRKADYPLPVEFDQAYRAADILVTEADTAKLQEPATQQQLLAASMYADGSTVDQHLSPAAYGALTAYCASNNIPLPVLSQFKPGMLVTMLTVMELMKQGVTMEGVDLHYGNRARKDQKSVDGLETVEEQIRFVSTMADGQEDQFVIHGLADMGAVKSQMYEMVKAWRAGDMDKLDAAFVAEMKTKFPKIYQRLLLDRNNVWLTKLGDYLKTPKTEFVLVGSAHLVGADGLLAALKKKGCTVEQLLPDKTASVPAPRLQSQP